MLSLELKIRVFAGLVILISLALGHWHSPHWQWLTAFVGLNLIQSAFTGFCPVSRVLEKM